MDWRGPLDDGSNILWDARGEREHGQIQILWFFSLALERCLILIFLVNIVITDT